MSKKKNLLVLSLISFSLTGCNLPSNLNKDSDGYEEYLTNEKNYTKFTDIKDLNAEIFDKAYFWGTTNETDNYVCYTTTQSHFGYIHKNEKKVMFAFNGGGFITVQEKDNAFRVLTEEDVTIDENGNKSDDPDNVITMEELTDGWLFYYRNNYLVYVAKGYNDFYICEDWTNTFSGPNGKIKKFENSELVTNAINAHKDYSRITLPAPSTGEYEIWGGVDYYKDHPSHYTVYIAGVSPQAYSEVLKQNGFTVIRSYEDSFYTFYGENGGYWMAYDEEKEIKVLLSYQSYLYTSSLGKTYGPDVNTCAWFYKIHRFNSKSGRTEETDWTDDDKTRMSSWYDGTIDASKVPFPQLGPDYYVPTTMSYAHTGLMDGTLKLHSQCFNIVDNSIEYLLDGYGSKLEEAGFHKYVPSYDLSVYEQRKSFQNTEDSKYIECYINDEEDIAVKFYFDVDNGNTVRIFKKSEMKSWLQDEK